MAGFALPFAGLGAGSTGDSGSSSQKTAKVLFPAARALGERAALGGGDGEQGAGQCGEHGEQGHPVGGHDSFRLFGWGAYGVSCRARA